MHEEDVMRGATAVELQIGKLDLGPDDVLVIKTQQRMSHAAIDVAMRALERVGIGRDRALFVGAEIDLSVLSAPEPCRRCGTPSRGECKRADCARKAFDVVGGE